MACCWNDFHVPRRYPTYEQWNACVLAWLAVDLVESPVNLNAAQPYRIHQPSQNRALSLSSPNGIAIRQGFISILLTISYYSIEIQLKMRS
ncbi:hypothetical protein K432DRAFT_150469 [Lepidopterella palustris CBS 459.81]|uniref:Uncharacterized protein n=1 Tax=Lepidopterella palustris CBS 459.81 TaxID=1314670 RepID=A0A8E2E2V7_9PEZI|nr:hypothetical protein K432DRAFT_150469 [Lepidopterella palustris CBS 459.81]